MRKFLIALALVASPAYAEIPFPSAEASFEERLEYVRAVNAETARKDKETLERIEQLHRETKVKMGLPADYQSYGTGRGCRYSCVTTVYVGSKMYRVRVVR